MGVHSFNVLAIVGLAACVPPHGPAIPALPSKGGPPWVELTSEHFVMWTDASAQRGRELVREMENHRLVVLGVALNNADSKTKSFVIALRDAEEVASYVPPQFIAYASGGSPVHQPVIILAADTEAANIHIITHELTHVITWSVVPNQPHWFAEGLAGYFETARLDAGRETVDVGEPLDYIVQRLRSAHWISTASLFGCTELACMNDMFYAQTWALVSFLVNEHPAELQRYMRRLAELPSTASDKAWLDAFPGMTPDKLDHALTEWLAHGRRAVLHYKLKLRDWPVTERPLGDGDALAARGLLRFMFTKDAPETRGELTAALAVDRTNLLAHLVLTAITKSIAPEDARAITTAHPDDWRAWWLLGFAVQHGPEAFEARQKLCALVAANPSIGPQLELCGSHGVEPYHGARNLCSEHVVANSMHVEWTTWATADDAATVTAYYEAATGRTAVTKPDGVSMIDGERSLVIFPASRNDRFPHCDTKPTPGESTVILMSQAIR